MKVYVVYTFDYDDVWIKNVVTDKKLAEDLAKYYTDDYRKSTYHEYDLMDSFEFTPIYDVVYKEIDGNYKVIECKDVTFDENKPSSNSCVDAENNIHIRVLTSNKKYIIKKADKELKKYLEEDEYD